MESGKVLGCAFISVIKSQTVQHRLTHDALASIISKRNSVDIWNLWK